MFIGHFAPAFLAAAHKNSPSLTKLVIAGQLADWGFFTLALAGVEKMRITPGITAMNPMDLYHMPYTHSLVGTLALAAIFGMIVSAMTKNRIAALLGFAVVISHWFLDTLVHTKDMTLAGNPPKLGLGLWNYPAIEMPLELLLTFGSLWIYARATGGIRKPIWALAAVLLALQTYNWFGPVPTEPELSLYALGLLAFALVTGVAWWVERTRPANMGLGGIASRG